MLSAAELRKGFLAQAVPVMLQGVGGPGAPHHFEFTRRECFGYCADSFSSVWFSFILCADF